MHKRTIDFATYKQLHDQAHQKYTNQNYFGGYTYPEFIARWITHDIYVGVLDHLVLKEFDGTLSHQITDLESRREAEIEDMAMRYWKGDFTFPAFLLRQTIKKTLDTLRLHGKLKEDE